MNGNRVIAAARTSVIVHGARPLRIMERFFLGGPFETTELAAD
jgi:hypothetical protein